MRSKENRQLSSLPHVNWELLFDEWLVTGMPNKYEFLRAHDLDPKHKVCQMQMKLWDKGVAKVIDSVAVTYGEKQAQETIRPAASAWEIIQKFRETQARSDFRRANMIAKHVEDQLSNSWEKVQIKDEETGEVFFEEFKSTLSSAKLKNLSEVCEKIQRIQRLALGLTTDNLGVDQPSTTDTTVEKKDDKKGPVFIVEVNRNGKFVSPRPKRIE